MSNERVSSEDPDDSAADEAAPDVNPGRPWPPPGPDTAWWRGDPSSTSSAGTATDEAEPDDPAPASEPTGSDAPALETIEIDLEAAASEAATSEAGSEIPPDRELPVEGPFAAPPSVSGTSAARAGRGLFARTNQGRNALAEAPDPDPDGTDGTDDALTEITETLPIQPELPEVIAAIVERGTDKSSPAPPDPVANTVDVPSGEVTPPTATSPSTATRLSTAASLQAATSASTTSNPQTATSPSTAISPSDVTVEAVDIVAEHEPLAIAATPADISADISAEDQADDPADAPAETSKPAVSRNAAPTGFPAHRMPAARTGAMPELAAPTDAARPGVAGRSAMAPAGPAARSDDQLAPRQPAGEPDSALALFFEPAPATTQPGPPADPRWPVPGMRVVRGHRPDEPIPSIHRKRIKDPRSPLVGLVALILFAFIATFFAWFSAGPLWLSLGHSHRGLATVANCPVAGIDKRCAEFVAEGNRFSARVTLLGPNGERARQGSIIPAEMVSSSATTAYAGDRSSLYLRWIPGLAMVLLCGLGIAWATGAFRMTSPRARTVALIASVGGPILITVGMLVATW